MLDNAMMDSGATDWNRPFGEKLPGLTRRLNPLLLADLPTPLEKLQKLGERVGHDDLYIKRDDASSGLYGGNKVRKLEFLLGVAKQEGATTLVTMGGTGSNHLLATALHGRAQGMRTVGVVFPQPESEKVTRNLEADRGAGVEIVRIPSKYLLPFYVAKALAMVRLREGRSAALIPGGGSSPVGALGFVNAGLEFAGQVKAGLMPEPSAIVLPYGTGGTAAGLALGLRLSGLETRVFAVRVIDRLLANRPRMLAFLRATARLLGSEGDLPDPLDRLGTNLDIRQGYIGPGYGHSTQKAQQAMTLFRELESIRLEATYTGKAAAAFLDLSREIKGPLVFWHTYSSADIEKWVLAGRGAP